MLRTNDSSACSCLLIYIYDSMYYQDLKYVEETKQQSKAVLRRVLSYSVQRLLLLNDEVLYIYFNSSQIFYCKLNKKFNYNIIYTRIIYLHSITIPIFIGCVIEKYETASKAPRYHNYQGLCSPMIFLNTATTWNYNYNQDKTTQ